MSIFSKIPWKVFGYFAPVVAEIARQAKDYAFSSEDIEIEQLNHRVARLETEKAIIYKVFKWILISGVTISLISLAGLILGIIALTR